MVTSFKDESAKIRLPTFIHRTGISRRIGGSERRHGHVMSLLQTASDRNLLSIGPITPKFIRPDCVQ